METKPKILIVDDDVDFATAISTVLKNNGFIADTAHDMDSTISKTKDTEYDLTFMDMKLPDASGLEIFKKIKEVRPDAKVIIMTGDIIALSKIHGKSLSAGMIEKFLRKPFSPDEIINIVKKYTSNQ